MFAVPAHERFRVCVRTGDADHSAHAHIMDISWTEDRKTIKETQALAFLIGITPRT